MVSCCGKLYSVSHQGRLRQCPQASHRLGVVLGLFALFALLASHVVHTVDIASEVARFPDTFGATLQLHSPRTSTVLSTTTAVPPEKFHDPFLCPVCQILSQTRHGLVSTGSSLSAPQRSVMYSLGCIPRYTGPLLAALAPRAPPSLT